MRRWFAVVGFAAEVLLPVPPPAAAQEAMDEPATRRHGSLIPMRVLTILATLALAAHAHAQTVVVPAGNGRPDPELEARLEAAAGDAGFDVVTGTDAVERTRLVPVGAVPDELKRELGETAETVLELVASGESEQSVARGTPVLEHAEAQLAAVGGDAQASQDLTNLCLYLVRAELQQAGEDAASAQARACWRLVPDLPVDERLHPPAVRQLVQRVRADIDAGNTVLSLHAAPGAPGGCAILLNGRPVGETPEVRLAVVPGQYSVGTSCREGAGVARMVAVEESAVHRVLLHPRLETALRVTRRGPWLIYGDADVASARASADAWEFARLAELPEAIAVVREGARLRLSRVVIEPSAPPRVVGETTAAPADAAELEAAFTRLHRGGPAVAGSEGGAGDSRSVAWVAFGVGAAGALAWGVFGTLALLEDSSLQDECATRACTDDDVSDLRTFSLLADVGLGVTVAGALTGALVLAFSGGDHVEGDAGLSWAPWMGAGSGGMAVHGAF